MELSSSHLQQHSIARQPVPGWNIEVITRQTILYSAAVLLLSAAISYLFAAVQLRSIPSAGAMYLFASVFWSVGVAHIFIFPPLLALLHSEKGLGYSLMLAVLICLAVWTVFYITGFLTKQLAIAAGTAFLLPHLLERCVDYYYRIPVLAKYPGWVIPPDATADTRMSLLLNSIYFRIKIKVDETDAASTLFTVTLPDKLTLSAVFLRFLHDQHAAIAITNHKLQPYTWQFSIKRKFGFLEMLDPDETLKENAVREGDEIVIERTAAALQP